MIYALSIDWLSIFCLYEGEGIWQPVEHPNGAGSGFQYKLEQFGTRCFSRFYRVRVPNEEGGFDDFAEIQASPYSSILPPDAVIIRFTNRTLYLSNFWELADDLLIENKMSCRGISRIDICADFNDFATIAPRALIERFAAKTLRHIGRGVGALYFDHKVVNREYGVNYTGLSFGTHASDAHVYLYNKSFELLTQGDKPWIRDVWKNIGLDIRNVWRLEVSIKSGGLKFKDKQSKQLIEVNVQDVYNPEELDKIYQTFVRKLFAFVVNRKGITNITREPRIVLFDEKPAYDRGSIRNLSAGSRMERILIKSLYQFSDKYRGSCIFQAKEQTQHFAEMLSYATGLHDWLEEKKEEWETPIHK